MTTTALLVLVVRDEDTCPVCGQKMPRRAVRVDGATVGNIYDAWETEKGRRVTEKILVIELKQEKGA